MCHWLIGFQRYTTELSYADIPFVTCITGLSAARFQPSYFVNTLKNRIDSGMKILTP
jgi:hypothetical protein